jgi:hypothetical protein
MAEEVAIGLATLSGLAVIRFFSLHSQTVAIVRATDVEGVPTFAAKTRGEGMKENSPMGRRSIYDRPVFVGVC